MQSHYGNSQKPHIQATLQWSWSHSLQSEDLVLLKYHQHKLLVLLIFSPSFWTSASKVLCQVCKPEMVFGWQAAACQSTRGSAEGSLRGVGQGSLPQNRDSGLEALMKTNTYGLYLWWLELISQLFSIRDFYSVYGF